MDEKIIIIGAGPTGLGAALRLYEKGYKNWKIFEQENHVGGLSASFRDDKGFTWDQGGHVIFSHYSYFDNLVASLLKNNSTIRQRESWIFLWDRWIPYPFQNNIRFLPPDKILDCLKGFYKVRNLQKKAANFKEWICLTFGKGVAELFMLPYNLKVWATELEAMSQDWIAERVSLISFERVLENVMLDKDDVSWGPNHTFRYPKKGGTGAIFEAMKAPFADNLHLSESLESVDINNHLLKFSGGREEDYDTLISTIPIDRLVEMIEPKNLDLCLSAKNLIHNSVYVVGIGLEKPTKGTRCWMYFPEAGIPFYRVTNFSFYSPFNVPEGNASKYSSLLCEIAFSKWKKVKRELLEHETLNGLIKSGLLEEADRRKVISIWVKELPYAYPVPSLNRDEILRKIQRELARINIYSRGRFGAWKYEVGNMDHSVMMGVEVVDRILHESREPTGSFSIEEKVES